MWRGPDIRLNSILDPTITRHPPSHLHRIPRLPSNAMTDDSDWPRERADPLVVLLPLLIVLSTLLFLLLLFLVCILLLRRRRAIILRENDGPIDLSREDFLEHDGGFEIIENRWLDSVGEAERAAYRRAKGAFRCLVSPALRF